MVNALRKLNNFCKIPVNVFIIIVVRTFCYRSLPFCCCHFCGIVIVVVVVIIDSKLYDQNHTVAINSVERTVPTPPTFFSSVSVFYIQILYTYNVCHFATHFFALLSLLHSLFYSIFWAKVIVNAVRWWIFSLLWWWNGMVRRGKKPDGGQKRAPMKKERLQISLKKNVVTWKWFPSLNKSLSSFQFHCTIKLMRIILYYS